MLKNALLSSILAICFLAACTNSDKNHVNRLRDFDGGWNFYRGDVQDAMAPGFDDSGWRKIDLPHDWSLEDLPDQKAGEVIGPFTRNSGGPRDGMSTGHTAGGTGWYRKVFILDRKDAGKEISLYFEGAYMETDVWINGTHVASHKHGYTSFPVDITAQCKPPGEKNILAVRVMNKGQNSRWYSGSGLYRHVRLLAVNKLHVGLWRTFITTPKVSEEEAVVKVETRIENREGKPLSFVVRYRILGSGDGSPAGSEIPGQIDPESEIITGTNITIPKPNLWSPDSAGLYTLETSILVKGRLIDQTNTEFGIRSIRFSAQKGFELNGKSLELKGGCVHHDNGVLGAAAIDRAEERKVELLKSNGFNAVRSSHCPPSEKFLEYCDRLGILVIDEAFDMWQKPKNPDDYHLYFDEHWKEDFSSMILRDRNHPSVILWSIGNEIEERADPAGLEIARNLKATALELDPTRFITGAICEFWDHPGRTWQETAPAFEILGVGGYNYQLWQYENDHKLFPERIIVGTESVPMHAFENWRLVENQSYVIGDFVWTAMDYLGESGIGHAVPDTAEDGQLMPWPWFNANCGDIDITGQKKPQSFYRDVIWNNSPVEMAVHAPLGDGVKEKISYWGWPDERKSWTWSGHENEMLDVNVYSRGPRVRLVLNGKTVGELNVSEETKFTAQFKVPYQPGELKAFNLKGMEKQDSISLMTCCSPVRIHLSADRTIIRANRNDLAYVTVEIVDEFDRVVPDAEIPVEFKIEGAGVLAGAGSANPSYMASFRQPSARSYRGRCLVILKPTGKAGEIRLTASSPGLDTASISIRTIET